MDIVIYGTLCAEGEERVAAYRLLELAISRELGMDTVPEIAREVGGKPFFPRERQISFNISHSHGAAVVALHDQSIGIDVEKLRPAPKRLSAGMESDAFFRWWTIREASVKKRGGSIAPVLHGEIEVDPLCRVYEDLLPGYIVAVCPSFDAEIRVEFIGEEQL